MGVGSSSQEEAQGVRALEIQYNTMKDRLLKVENVVDLSASLKEHTSDLLSSRHYDGDD